jgi:hypothetical protein
MMYVYETSFKENCPALALLRSPGVGPSVNTAPWRTRIHLHRPTHEDACQLSGSGEDSEGAGVTGPLPSPC